MKLCIADGTHQANPDSALLLCEIRRARRQARFVWSKLKKKILRIRQNNKGLRVETGWRWEFAGIGCSINDDELARCTAPKSRAAVGSPTA
jgi:hypothetical protein